MKMYSTEDVWNEEINFDVKSLETTKINTKFFNMKLLIILIVKRFWGNLKIG